MSYTYLDHDADIGIQCSGASLEEAFEEGGRALFELMADPRSIRPDRTFPVECRAPGIDSLFVEFLNEILSLAGRKETVFSLVEVRKIAAEGEDWVLRGTLGGEEIDPLRHDLRTEVKGATYFGLSLTEEDGLFTLRCVLDI